MEWLPTETQKFALTCPPSKFPELGFGGARGGGKTEGGIAKMTQYDFHPKYRGLAIRKNYEDLKDWIDRATIFFKGSSGARIKDGDFYFPKGGIIRTGHFKDDKSFQKYVGHEYHIILVEELNLIPREENYLKLFGSCRTTVPELYPQMFSTFNPSDEGFYWIKNRFGLHGIPTEPVITKDNKTGRLRVFIPSKLDDNPHLQRDENYRSFLEQLPDGLREAWLLGSWDEPQIQGAYFTVELEQAQREGRIKLVPIDKSLKVHSVWDLGISKGNAMTIGLFQRVKGEIRLIAAYANEGLGVNHYIAWLQEYQRTNSIIYGKHFAPFDIKERERSTGKTTKDIVRTMGIEFEDVPVVDRNSGIERVRLMFPRLWINEPYCLQAISGFRSYKKVWDEKRLMWKAEPLHDWASNWGDMLRYAALVEDKMTNEEQKPKWKQPEYEPFSPLESVPPKPRKMAGWDEEGGWGTPP